MSSAHSKRAALASGPLNPGTLRGLAFVGVDSFRTRAAIHAARALVAIDQFDHRERSVVAMAEARLQHARVAAGARLIARGERVEELLGLRLVAHARQDQTAR